MKAFRIVALLSLVFLISRANAQERGEINLADSTGMPGDNFSLQGALELFKKAKSLEDFEKQLNDKENSVNNLDLDGDGKTDYVRVIDNTKESVHAIVLQVPISKTESQDVAVIELEKDGDKSAFVQIVGNEDVYGEEKILEPAEDVEPSDGGNSKHGPSAYSPGRPAIYVNVWFWPCVPLLFAPTYVVWVSPWYWGYYPPYWSPWPPSPWRWHYMSCSHYHHHYHYHNYHRSTYAHQVYAPRRTSSPHVNHRYEANRKNYKANVTSRPRPSNGTTTSPGRPSRPGTNNPSIDGRPSRPGTNNPAIDSKPTRPTTQPSTRPQTRPETRPQTKPATRPQTKPGNGSNNNSQVKPSSRPQTKPATRPQTKPSQSSRPQQAPKQGGQKHR
ncbi:MAG: hypothetical protein IPP71_02935 [Bacteroidetes bacterium]|nr:hypothetical protein [Bacteroidota bacterium]